MRASTPYRASGLSLIELMIALLIGLFLVMGLIQIFTASRAAYQLSEGLARTQENGRFAIDYLQRDVRMAGHSGCVNDQSHAQATPNGYASTMGTAHPALRFDISVQGYEANNTGPGSTLTIPATPVTGGATWTPALPTQIANVISNRVQGSDIIALRYFAPEGVPVTAITGTAQWPIFSFDSTRWNVLRSGVQNPGLFGIADCLHATVFHASATNGVAGSVTSGSGGLNTTGFSTLYTSGQSVIYRAESLVYYIGINGDGQRSLYRARFTVAPGGAALAGQAEELVEGIDNMQIIYGRDRQTNMALRPTGYIDRLSTAADVPNTVDAWRRVGSVQIGLLAASPGPAVAATPTLANISQGVALTPPTDSRYRAVYQTTVAMRNRLYGW